MGIIKMKAREFEPETFSPMIGFVVFTKESAGEEEILGCANLDFHIDTDEYKEINLKYLEAYNNNGAIIVDFLMSQAPEVSIIGDSYLDTQNFWKKMGAEFYSAGKEINLFELQSEEFRKTKYCSNI